MNGFYVGARFGSLVVTGFFNEARASGTKRRMASCVCDCGASLSVEKYNLSSGNTQRCGECSRISRGSKHKKHGCTYSAGMEKTPAYKAYYTWCAMKRRCENAKSPSYKSYGGRGICVCQAWSSSFETFLNDMGLPPDMDSQIDRIDNNGPYSPENCRWTTRKVNARNKRNNKILSVEGVEITLAQASEESGIPYERLKARLARGISASEAIKPKLTKKQTYKVGDKSYRTLEEAAVSNGLGISGAHSRFKSDRYPDWRIIKI